MEEAKRAKKGALPKKKVEEIHHSSSLVGRIVEKGFSSSSSPQKPPALPRPNVLPFPVARHRSHGPHWAPVATTMDVDEEEAGDNREETEFDSIASLASAVQRKEKKGVDFSRWREFVAEEPGVTAKSKVKKKISLDPSVPAEKVVQAKPVDEKQITAEVMPRETAGGNIEIEDLPVAIGNESLKEKEKNLMFNITSSMVNDDSLFSSTSNLYANGSSRIGPIAELSLPPSSLIEEIDSENRTRLSQMSQDEISEARAEIIGKMDPAILEMLKKRGRDKTGGKRNAKTSDSGKTNETFKSDSKVKGGKSSTSEGPSAVTDQFQPSGIHGNIAWKSWSEKVEKARDLRFTLNGDIVKNICHSDMPAECSQCSQYKAENVTERDFLRTEGDPGAAGYTIKEAVALVRSMVAGQRAFALHLLASVLSKSLNCLQPQGKKINMGGTIPSSNFVDWQALWAYALGPEPQMVLALRIALDDNHNSVVLACARVIECILSCELNESFFNILEKSSLPKKYICTAPVFRSRPEPHHGFLQGGFWKYNTKSSNIHLSHDFDENVEAEGKHTIQDDVVVAGQDVAAGLVRMGILPRICYLLEMDPLPSLEESLVSILVGLARHSQTSANAIMECPRLVQTVINRFTKLIAIGNRPVQIKSVLLLKVLSEASRENCLHFVNCGFFQQITWQLYKSTESLDIWINSGKDHCKFTSALMVQQLRFWKVCIQYGYCISYFADFFPAMSFWLTMPTFENLTENDVLGEFTSVTTESYLVLEVLSQRLPRLHCVEQLNKKDKKYPNECVENWSWSYAVPMVELALKWLSLKYNPFVDSSCRKKWIDKCIEDSSICHMLWVISAVMHMLSTVIDRITMDDATYGGENLPWLPYFVPNVGLEIVKNGFLDFSELNVKQHEEHYNQECSLADGLCNLRHHNDIETALSSVCCLHGLMLLVKSIDKSIREAKVSISKSYFKDFHSSLQEKILEDGIAKRAYNELQMVLLQFVGLTTSNWRSVQSIEMFGRGGPAPGVGIGWGSAGGGFWSRNALLAQADAHFILSLHDIIPVVDDEDVAYVKALKPALDYQFNHISSSMQRINMMLGICLVAGPGDRDDLEKALNILLQTPVLMYLNVSIHHFLHLNRYKLFGWCFQEDDYLLFSKTLIDHFRNKWLVIKRKSSDKLNVIKPLEKRSKKNDTLETIPEDSELSKSSCEEINILQTEWGHQRLPLPVIWFLSPISTVSDSEATHFLQISNKSKNKMKSPSTDVSDVVRSGLFFLLGLESMSYFLSNEHVDSALLGVSLVWKLHALSMALLVKMDILEDEKSRDIFETLQVSYGEHMNQLINRNNTLHGIMDDNLGPSLESSFSEVRKSLTDVLDFQSQVHESYNTFIETLVEQFASVSYGDTIYGRQVALYLHRLVEAPVRLATWNALSNACVLELLPAFDGCIAEAEGYLEPIEDNDAILEAYVKSWISGGLDKAASRGSMSFYLALHHLSVFIFDCSSPHKLALRNKLVKSLLRGFSRRHQHQGMLLNLINYRPPLSQEHNRDGSTASLEDVTERRFAILSEACEGNSSIIAEVQKLKVS